MKVFVQNCNGKITLRIRAEGPEGTLGDASQDIRPGETVLGKTYEEWAAIKTGSVEIDKV